MSLPNNTSKDEQQHSSEKSDRIEELSASSSFVESSVSPTRTISRRRVSTPVSLLIESLVQNLCSTYESNPTKAARMYNIICDRLFKMNLIDESFAMREFEGMRTEYHHAIVRIMSSVKNGDKSLPLTPVWPKIDITNSHYLREFDEVEYINGGGFGKVYKVRHKLDSTQYAIKKIPIHSEGIESVKSYLSEVKTFASLNHSNIVQYKAAWLEIGPPTTTTNTFRHQKTKVTINGEMTNNYVHHFVNNESFSDNNKQTDSTDFVVEFEHSVSGGNGFVGTSSSCKKKREKRHSVSEGAMAICQLNAEEIERIRNVNKQKIMWATLYIQMALCQCTLKDWLEKRNCVPVPEKAVVLINEQAVRTNNIRQILIQILKGLEYIHSKRIVHHDIKPSNIFIELDNGSLLIQLGDFGLACPLQSVRHSLAFGTKMYAAPEQLAGQCDFKSDMYSVGIVLFELVENFNTDMERVGSITELRKGHIPSYLLTKYPEFVPIISKLMSKPPANRPNATELLHGLKIFECDQIEVLKNQLRERDEEILQLKELLKSHGINSQSRD